MTEEEKKRNLYGGTYDQQIQDTYNQMNSRPAFSYDLDGDALYQQYRDRYTQNAKLAMKDTMGQAAALTGGYGNSYAQGVGQQRYDETMRGLTDMIPQLEERAYKRWGDQNSSLLQRYQMLMNMGQAERETANSAYSRLYALIGSTGYMPSAQELQEAGMSQEAANALQTNWANGDPEQAYYNGVITAEQYYAITGKWPRGYQAASGGGGGGGGGGNNTNPGTPIYDDFGNLIGYNSASGSYQQSARDSERDYWYNQLKATGATDEQIWAILREMGY